MKVIVSGSSGMVGSAVVAALQRKNHSVVRLIRPGGHLSADDAEWHTESGQIDLLKLESAEAIVHLAGASIAGGRWTPERKKLLRASRVEATQNLVSHLRQLKHPPKAFICASAIGYYGSRSDETLSEASSAGKDFLAMVTRDWEAAALSAESIGSRAVILRFGMILTKQDGALAKMLPPFKLGVGGKLGSGKQWISWVVSEDVVGVILTAIQNVNWRGPMNVVSPNPVTNEAFTRTLARVLHRPAILPVPGFMLRLVFGEMADALLLSSQRVLPEKLLASGYPFAHTNLEPALHSILD